ncbi:hypothetical protein CKA38_07995 [Ereboglobus luteus]|uniref:TonB-dependent receptor plug domain-containing protein n=1 Tax=Ereboglobus luteus TaxID=1796921 RepID=A0A2U8E2T4_9BACT|nr:hypothetical protein CKA38_07995 [Ereboglobus luteus]
MKQCLTLHFAKYFTKHIALTDDENNPALELSMPRQMRAGPARLMVLSIVLMLCAAGPSLRAQALQPDLNKLSDDTIITLDELVVSSERDPADENYDSTGMGGPDAELEEAPFADELTASESRHPEEFDVEITNELELASGASPVDLVTAVNRVNLRGFPTPRLRNGFSQTGIPEIINVNHTQLIQGPIISVTGRAAPGGIQNYITGRPLGRSRVMLYAMGNSVNVRDVRFDESTPIIQKKLWQRVAAGWRQTKGPMSFAHIRTRYLNAQLTYKHSRSTSIMFSVDYLELDGNPSSGIPEYREKLLGKIVGPYLPLATFNAFGPNASVDKQLLSTTLQVETRLTRRVSMRANLFAYDRRTTDDRYTTGQYIIEDDRYSNQRYTGKFGGTRYPRRIEQPMRALIGSVEATARLLAGRTDSKVTLRVEHTHSSYKRIDRRVRSANSLPADVRIFDPYAPNYYRPEFSEEAYDYFVTNRREAADYTSIALSDRTAFWRGKLVATAGGRIDVMSIDIHDRRPNAAQENVHSNVTKFTWHGGANYVVRPGRLLFFAGISKAVEPSTRVDARTGDLQGNESTFGYEAGLKGMFFDKRLGATLLLFQYYNQNISRGNPLYNDPVDDADHTQPQLLSAVEERFTGGSLDLKATLARGFTITSRIAYIDPITTKSPDFPGEVDRVVTRMPKTTIGVTARYTFQKSAPKLLAGLSTSVTLTHVSDFVAHYGNYAREYLDYPSNTLVSLSISRTWLFGDKKRPMRHTLSASVRNLFDRDQLNTLHRIGQQRALTLSYRFLW